MAVWTDAVDAERTAAARRPRSGASGVGRDGEVVTPVSRDGRWPWPCWPPDCSGPPYRLNSAAGDSRWLYLSVIAVLLVVLIIGDPGRIDRDKRWLRVTTVSLIGVISAANAVAAVKLVIDILNTTQYETSKFTNNAHILLVSGGAIWLTNVIAFGLWYWDVDGGGAAARARGPVAHPAFIFPEMVNSKYVVDGWYPRFVDYLHLSFHAATAFSPTDVSAIRSWAKLMMMAEEAISLVVAILVVARAVNILN